MQWVDNLEWNWNRYVNVNHFIKMYNVFHISVLMKFVWNGHVHYRYGQRFFNWVGHKTMCMHTAVMSIFSINYVTVRPTKIMNWAHFKKIKYFKDWNFQKHFDQFSTLKNDFETEFEVFQEVVHIFGKSDSVLSFKKLLISTKAKLL